MMRSFAPRFLSQSNRAKKSINTSIKPEMPLSKAIAPAIPSQLTEITPLKPLRRGFANGRIPSILSKAPLGFPLPQNTSLLFQKPKFEKSNPKYAHIALSPSPFKSFEFGGLISVLAGVGIGFLLLQQEKAEAKELYLDYEKIRKDIANLLESDPKYDDGSFAPILIRLAWHAAGTYDKATKTGGSNGAGMRYEKEGGDGANAGLAIARQLLEPIKKKYPELSYADLWTLASIVAIAEIGGPKINWRPGRSDFADDSKLPPRGRLPNASLGADHIREVFYRMGFNDQEIVALIGAHALGRCHKDRSGYEGPWTKSPTMFSNEFFRELVENKWTYRKWTGPQQYTDPTGELMMLPADIALLKDPEFSKHVKAYAKDEELFFRDFAKAYEKLMELGVKF